MQNTSSSRVVGRLPFSPRYSRQDTDVSVLLCSTAVISWLKGVSAFGITLTARAGGVMSEIIQLKVTTKPDVTLAFRLVSWILDVPK